MPVSFDPELRLRQLAEYVLKVHLNLGPEEAEVQLLRCRLVGYSLAAQLASEGYGKKYIDSLMAEAYKNLEAVTGRVVTNPYADPCASQYAMLDWLRSLAMRDPAEPFMIFIRAEFRKVFVPTLRLLTALCGTKNKYTWEEVRDQLQEIMRLLQVEAAWEECESHLERYLQKVAPIMGDEFSL